MRCWPGLTMLAALAACTAATPPPQPTGGIGVFSSLPLLWEESDGIGDLLSTTARRPWTASALARAGKVVPLDRLNTVPADVALLVIAQPRPLAPDENVALDDWVRAGGHVLLFADPLLTAESRFALGDKRRPHDIVLLSPILTRWGLRLDFDDEQDPTEREATAAGVQIPVAMPGQFAATGSDCTVDDDGLSARCRLGKGVVLAVADAALFDHGAGDDSKARAAALAELIALARK